MTSNLGCVSRRSRPTPFWVRHLPYCDPRFYDARVDTKGSDKNVLFAVAGPRSVHLHISNVQFAFTRFWTTYQHLGADLPIDFIYSKSYPWVSPVQKVKVVQYYP